MTCWRSLKRTPREGSWLSMMSSNVSSSVTLRSKPKCNWRNHIDHSEISGHSWQSIVTRSLTTVTDWSSKRENSGRDKIVLLRYLVVCSCVHTPKFPVTTMTTWYSQLQNSGGEIKRKRTWWTGGTVDFWLSEVE